MRSVFVGVDVVANQLGEEDAHHCSGCCGARVVE